jgi:hypothetical protein
MTKARIINNIARYLMKAGKFSEAADYYSKIINDYHSEPKRSEGEESLIITEFQFMPEPKEMTNIV